MRSNEFVRQPWRKSESTHRPISSKSSIVGRTANRWGNWGKRAHKLRDRETTSQLLNSSILLPQKKKDLQGTSVPSLLFPVFVPCTFISLSVSSPASCTSFLVAWILGYGVTPSALLRRKRLLNANQSLSDSLSIFFFFVHLHLIHWVSLNFLLNNKSTSKKPYMHSDQ